jgi:hypothetical protein
MSKYNRGTTARYEKILEQRAKNVERDTTAGRGIEKSDKEPFIKEKTNLNELTPEARQEILRRQIKQGASSFEEPSLMGEEGAANVSGLGGAAVGAILGHLANKYPDLNPLHIHDAGEDSDIIPEDDQLDPRFKKIKGLIGQ